MRTSSGLLVLLALLGPAGAAAAGEVAVTVSVANAPPRILDAGWAVRDGLAAWAEVEDLNGAGDVASVTLRSRAVEVAGEVVAREGVVARVEAAVPLGAALEAAELVVVDAFDAVASVSLAAPAALAAPLEAASAGPGPAPPAPAWIPALALVVGSALAAAAAAQSSGHRERSSARSVRKPAGTSSRP